MESVFARCIADLRLRNIAIAFLYTQLITKIYKKTVEYHDYKERVCQWSDISGASKREMY